MVGSAADAMSRRRAGSFVVILAGCFTACSSPATPSETPARWPNEPADLRLVTDWGFDQAPPAAGDVEIPQGSGWSVVHAMPPGPGSVTLVSDPTAPVSAPGVYDMTYPEGMVEGTAPATVYFPRTESGIMSRLPFMSSSSGLDTREIYVGFWWKPSAPFDTGPNGNKIAFIFNGGGDRGGQQFLILMPDGRLHVLPEYPDDFRWRRPNVSGTVVALGAWHRIEWYSNLATGSLMWWMDGVLQGRHADVWNAYSFDVVKLSPTWGGNTGARKRQTDHYWFDHIRISVR
jgi:hypothetical protein